MCRKARRRASKALALSLSLSPPLACLLANRAAGRFIHYSVPQVPVGDDDDDDGSDEPAVGQAPGRCCSSCGGTGRSRRRDENTPQFGRFAVGSMLLAAVVATAAAAAAAERKLATARAPAAHDSWKLARPDYWPALPASSWPKVGNGDNKADLDRAHETGNWALFQRSAPSSERRELARAWSPASATQVRSKLANKNNSGAPLDCCVRSFVLGRALSDEILCLWLLTQAALVRQSRVAREPEQQVQMV